MTILLAAIIASVLCGMLFALIWASSNTLRVSSNDVNITIILRGTGDGTGLELTVFDILRQFENMNTTPEIYISLEGLSEKGRKKAEYISKEYKLKTAEGRQLWNKQKDISK